MIQMVWIIDFSGYTTSNAPPISVAKETLNILSNHYPERLGNALLFDTPKIFSFFWTAIKPFINHVTRDKIIFCNGKAEENLKVVSKLFDMSTVPERFGGSSGFVYDHSVFWVNEEKQDASRKALSNTSQ
jgi:hypothetical protein